MTGRGKSQLARALFLSAPAPRLVIDPADSSATELDGAVTFHDATRATNDAGESWREAATARFVPHDPDDLDAYDAVYRWAFYAGPRRIWLDEAIFVLPSQGRKAPWARKYVVMGRKRQLGHQACHTRTVEIDPNLIAQAQHVFVFALPHPADRARIADLTGIALATLETELAALEHHGFLHWDQAATTLTAYPALRL